MKRHHPQRNDPGSLADTLGCPPTTLAELASLDRDRQQQLAILIEACQQRQRQAHEQALRAALPRFLRPLLGSASGQES
ncbi:MAG: hypothetical protein ACFE0K_09105 [Alcanivorax sp.]|uniref:hypothetical protein n=1 Tax=Alcanivorax sp. TaxID=1872427 RepID=UPI003DA775B2